MKVWEEIVLPTLRRSGLLKSRDWWHVP